MKFKYSDDVLDQDTNKLLFWHYDIYFKQMLWRDEVSSLPVLNSNELIVIQLKLWAVRAIGDRSMEAVNHRGQMGIFTLLEHFLNYKLWFSATSKIDLTEGNPKRYCRYVDKHYLHHMPIISYWSCYWSLGYNCEYNSAKENILTHGIHLLLENCLKCGR